jgi:hypothetical protein
VRSSVFINCPFDAEYRDCFEAIVFACYACGFVPRTALSVSGRKTLRLSALRELVNECDLGIHDLSRTEPDANGRPRFNMPFELGFFLGAKEFGGKRHRDKHTLVMVRNKYEMHAYLSGLSGLDPSPHGDDPLKAIRHVRDTLHHFLLFKAARLGAKFAVPGPLKIASAFKQFKAGMPKIAKSQDFDLETFNVLDAHMDYCHAVKAFLTSFAAAPGAKA